MNKTTYPVIAIVLAIGMAIGAGILIGKSLNPSMSSPPGSDSDGEREILYWVAPMDPNFRRDGPGKSPMGMDLVPVYAHESDGQTGVVTIDPTIVNNLGVRTASAERGPLPRRIETVGYVGYDEDTVQHVHTRVDGWIESLATKSTGDRVEKGQLLFELYSPALVNAQEEYLTALRSNNQLLLTASRERLAALGVDASEIERLNRERSVRQQTRFHAAADGVVVHLGVREGIYVTPTTEIMSVAELDNVWILAEVFERQAAWVAEGQTAMVELDYQPAQSWQGVVDYVYPELDPMTRTLTVRLRIDNAGEALLPNMFTRVTILANGSGDVIHVPRQAVIRGGTIDRVVVALGNGRFQVKPVRIGIESGNRIAIRSGLNGDEQVVISAQFLIDSESNIETALRRLESAQ